MYFRLGSDTGQRYKSVLNSRKKRRTSMTEVVPLSSGIVKKVVRSKLAK